MEIQKSLSALALIVLISGCGGGSGGEGAGSGSGGGTGGNEETPAELACGGTYTPFSVIQGTGNESPLVGQTVDITGVIHADFTGSERLDGFFVQSMDYLFDSESEASQGLFIYAPSVDEELPIGRRVVVRGEVSEGNMGTHLRNLEDLEVCDDTSDVIVTTLRFPVTESAMLERYENMAVRIENDMVVAGHHNLQRYGELYIASEMLWQPTETLAPGSQAQSQLDAFETRAIVLDDGSNEQNPDPVIYPTAELSFDNPVRLGDGVSQVEGVLTEAFNSYRIHPTQAPQFETLNVRTSEPSLAGEGDLKIASVNLLNYFLDNEDFTQQQTKLVSLFSAIDADVYALQELENNGFGVDSALVNLIDELNSGVEGTPFRFVNLDVSEIGAANITNALIYRSDRVTEVGIASFLDEGSFSFQTHRPPVAQTFEVIGSGARFTLVGNHIRSRNCGGDAERFQDQLDGQGCASIAREEATQELLAWLETAPTNDADAPVIIAGDFNSYSMETPARLIEEASFTNAKNLVDKEVYSYVFGGRLGSLDHIFVANEVSAALVDMDIWRVNADEPSAFGYESAFKSEEQQVLYYNSGPYRSSDHNPVVILLDSTKF